MYMVLLVALVVRTGSRLQLDWDLKRMFCSKVRRRLHRNCIPIQPPSLPVLPSLLVSCPLHSLKREIDINSLSATGSQSQGATQLLRGGLEWHPGGRGVPSLQEGRRREVAPLGGPRARGRRARPRRGLSDARCLGTARARSCDVS